MLRTGNPAFFGSLFLARLGDQVLLFLVPLVVFQTTHKVSWSGVAFFLETLPRYASFPLFGALADRASPLRLMRTSQVYRALACAGGVAGFHLVGGIGWLIALSMVCGVFASQSFVAREVMLPQVFRHMKFEKVLAGSQLADQLGTVLGPMVAAALFGVWRWEIVVGAAALIFVAADGAMALWQRQSRFEFVTSAQLAGHWTLPMRTALHHVFHLPGLRQVVALAAGENLVIGVTLATSAAMVTGIHHESDRYYAALQAAGAIATVFILLAIARSAWSVRTLGLVSFLAIAAGGCVAGLSSGATGYAIGFVLIVGFDKMFNVHIRSTRQRIIPSADYGKTTGMIVLLNNMTQPLAGLLVGMYAGYGHTGWLIVALSLVMMTIGAIVLLAGYRARRRSTAEVHGSSDSRDAA